MERGRPKRVHPRFCFPLCITSHLPPADQLLLLHFMYLAKLLHQLYHLHKNVENFKNNFFFQKPIFEGKNREYFYNFIIFYFLNMEYSNLINLKLLELLLHWSCWDKNWLTCVLLKQCEEKWMYFVGFKVWPTVRDY